MVDIGSLVLTGFAGALHGDTRTTLGALGILLAIGALTAAVAAFRIAPRLGPQPVSVTCPSSPSTSMIVKD